MRGSWLYQAPKNLKSGCGCCTQSNALNDSLDSIKNYKIHLFKLAKPDVSKVSKDIQNCEQNIQKAMPDNPCD